MSAINTITNTATAPYETNPDHSGVVNPLIKNVHTERQEEHEETYDSTGIHYVDSWIGDSGNINVLLNTLLPTEENIKKGTCPIGQNHVFRISRGNGDISKLTRTYEILKDDPDQPTTGSGNTLGEEAGITPWQFTTEQTDLDLYHYYVLMNTKLTEAEAKKINRTLLGAWDITEYSDKIRYVVEDYGRFSLNPDSKKPHKDTNKETYDVAKFWVKSGRETFTWFCPKIVHNTIENGYYRIKYKEGNLPGRLTNKPAKKDLTDSGIKFPTTFGKLIDTIPDFPTNWDVSNLTEQYQFYLADWSCQNYNGESQYLVTKTYYAWPKRFALLGEKPWPMSPTKITTK